MLIINKDFGFGHGLRSCEAYFRNPDEPWVSQYDIVKFFQARTSATSRNDRLVISKQFTTLIKDLAPDADPRDSLSKDAQYEIRLSEKKDKKSFLLQKPSAQQAFNFSEALALFYAEKGIPLNKNFYLNKFLEVLRHDALFFTYCFPDESRVPAVYHSYIVDGVRARLLNSFSFYRNRPPPEKQRNARLNTSLHLFDMQMFRNHGCREYDLGGVNMDPNAPAEQAAIARFKLKLQGALTTEYHLFVANSEKGMESLKRYPPETLTSLL